MRKILTTLAVLLPLISFSQPVTLQRNGAATQLMLHGKPFIILGGELANSTASSAEYMEKCRVWSTLKAGGLNTVLCPVYWELIEPEEGRFDFSSVDYLIESARKNDLHLVLLWFGTWKNSMSCYVPSWMKLQFGTRFTLAQTADGQHPEIISAFCKESIKSDCEAFATLMRHLKETDGETGTVLMVQVENEIGMLGSAREYGPAAQKAWNAGHRQGPALQGDSLLYEEERFQAKYYARYAGKVAAAGKKEYDIPMYVNTALNSRGRKPGDYPSAGPLDHLMDIWKAEAPAIDLISPDIYDDGFPRWIAKYSRDDNQLFVPEIRSSNDNGARAIYTIGRHSAIGFSPFSIETTSDSPEAIVCKLAGKLIGIDTSNSGLADAYGLLGQFTGMITKAQSEGRIYGVLVDKDHPTDTIRINDIDFICSHDGLLSWSPAYDKKGMWGEGAFLIIDMGEDRYLFLGTCCVATMRPADGRGSVGILSIDEVTDGELHTLRRLNGDEDHQGRHLRIPYGSCQAQLLHIYRY